MGGDFATLDAVPSDESVCEWTGNLLFGVITEPFDAAAAIGQGLLLRDRFAEKVYKALIVDDGVGYEDVGGYHGWIAFDYTRVRP